MNSSRTIARQNRPTVRRLAGRKFPLPNALRRLTVFTGLSLIGIALCLSAGLAAEPQIAGDLARSGWEYRRLDLKEPVPNRAHLFRADLQSGKVGGGVIVAPDPDGNGPAEASLTNPLKLGDDPRVVAFVNANPWDAVPDGEGRRNRRWYAGQPVDISGLAAAGGKILSPPQRGYPSVWFDDAGRIRLDDAAPPEAIRDGIAGFGWLVRDGKPCVESGGPRHPRTAVGVGKEDRALLLAVVDGRQPGFSEGMTLEELARLLAEQGCFNAINLDGGGSSVMALRTAGSELQVINSPSDRLLGVKPVMRPVPVLLIVRATKAD